MMKKILLIVSLACLSLFAGNAQSRTIGLRAGYKAVELSYQYQTGDKTMLEFDGGVGGKFWDSAKDIASWCDVTASFDWIFALNENWNVYLGPAAGLGYGFTDVYKNVDATRFRINLGAMAGIEYIVSPEFLISLDYRPMINLNGVDNIKHDYVSYYGAALGFRYCF